MNRIVIAIVLTVLSLGMLQGITYAQQNDYPVQITATIPTNGFSCGHASYPLYCYVVPTDYAGGSFWLDSYYNSTSAEGFIQFQNVGNLGYAQITGTAAYKNGSGQV